MSFVCPVCGEALPANTPACVAGCGWHTEPNKIGVGERDSVRQVTSAENPDSGLPLRRDRINRPSETPGGDGGGLAVSGAPESFELGG